MSVSPRIMHISYVRNRQCSFRKLRDGSCCECFVKTSGCTLSSELRACLGNVPCEALWVHVAALEVEMALTLLACSDWICRSCLDQT